GKMTGLLQRQIAIPTIELMSLKNFPEDLRLSTWVRLRYDIPYHLLPYCRQWHDDKMNAEIFDFRTKPFRTKPFKG
ncbi:hypothetical protein MUP77_14970, partial [Candidatus Bathyarchaeota archaeon]|nr:hypothetical protein [Candidatus Bathyarchaeota archaeon]